MRLLEVFQAIIVLISIKNIVKNKSILICALAILGGLVGTKWIAILGGVLMLAGPLLFLIPITLELGSFEVASTFIPAGESLIWGSWSGRDWGLGISFFLGIGAGVLGLIGGFTVD